MNKLELHCTNSITMLSLINVPIWQDVHDFQYYYTRPRNNFQWNL